MGYNTVFLFSFLQSLILCQIYSISFNFFEQSSNLFTEKKYTYLIKSQNLKIFRILSHMKILFMYNITIFNIIYNIIAVLKYSFWKNYETVQKVTNSDVFLS